MVVPLVHLIENAPAVVVASAGDSLMIMTAAITQHVVIKFRRDFHVMDLAHWFLLAHLPTALWCRHVLWDSPIVDLFMLSLVA